MSKFINPESFRKIVDGVARFQQKDYKDKEELFRTLAKGQQPKILFITCSDSRINTALITQTQPGDIFLITNAGNIIPPHGSAHGGIGASIEYAVSVLQVEHIIVCGHSGCGAMAALLKMESLDKLPAVKHWLSFAEATINQVECLPGLSEKEDKISKCVELNIPVQLNHLKTLPSVASHMLQKKLMIHGWVYHIDSGDIQVYQLDSESFVSFDEAYADFSPVISSANG